MYSYAIRLALKKNTMKLKILQIALIILLTACSTIESNDSKSIASKSLEIANPLVGSWKMKQIDYIYADTTYVVPMNVSGRFIVTPSSYAIMYNPYGNERKSPVDMSKMTDQEKLYSFQTTVFNSGSYEWSDSTFTTTADIAKVAGFEGGIQYYRISNKDGVMSITMFDETYPSGKKPEWYGKLEIKFLLEKD